jgi:hypothetical protein
LKDDNEGDEQIQNISKRLICIDSWNLAMAIYLNYSKRISEYVHLMAIYEVFNSDRSFPGQKNR